MMSAANTEGICKTRQGFKESRVQVVKKDRSERTKAKRNKDKSNKFHVEGLPSYGSADSRQLEARGFYP